MPEASNVYSKYVLVRVRPRRARIAELEIFYKHANPPDLWNSNAVGFMPDSGNNGNAGFAGVFCLKALISGTDFVLTKIYVE